MFAKRAPIRRIHEIHTAIRQWTYPNTTTLAQHFEVHRRTVARDIEYMRDQLRAPIAYDPAKRGYYYTEATYSLPIIQITEGELLALFLAEKVLHQYKGTPYEGLLRSAFSKLSEYLPDEVSIDLEKAGAAFSFDLKMTPSFSPEVFGALAQAIKEKKRIKITYQSPWSGKTSQREVDPYHLANVGGRWYMIGFCHARNQLRNFTPSRIRSIELTNTTFQTPENFQPNKLFESSFGVMTGKRLYNVRLKFNARVAGYIKETLWHPSQRIRDLPDGEIILTMRVSDLKEVKRWVLSWGENVEVFSPKRLRDGMCRTIGVLRQLYIGERVDSV